jgi:twitching motility protein PilT
MITQMEVGLHASSFAHGLELALQQDPDVVVVGELRDPLVARMALEAAEAGRKVLATMAGLYVIPTIARFITMIPQDAREVGIPQLTNALQGVIAQQLARTRDGTLRPAVEVLRGGVDASRSILENRLKDLRFLIEGRRGGMQSLDQHLLELHQAGVISGTETMRLAQDPEAVGLGLRALRQASVNPSPPDASLVDANQELLP